MLSKSLLSKCLSGVYPLQQWDSNVKARQSTGALVNRADLGPNPGTDLVWWVWGGQGSAAGPETLGNIQGAQSVAELVLSRGRSSLNTLP